MQHRAGNVLDPFHQLDEQIVIAGSHRREADAAVAHHRCGDAVIAGRRHAVGPGRLAIVVGVNVDEARRDQRPCRVDLSTTTAGDLADRSDNALVDGHIRRTLRGTGTVDDRTTTYHQIVLDHRSLPLKSTSYRHNLHRIVA